MYSEQVVLISTSQHTILISRRNSLSYPTVGNEHFNSWLSYCELNISAAHDFREGEQDFCRDFSVDISDLIQLSCFSDFVSLFFWKFRDF